MVATVFKANKLMEDAQYLTGVCPLKQPSADVDMCSLHPSQMHRLVLLEPFYKVTSTSAVRDIWSRPKAKNYTLLYFSFFLRTALVQLS